MKGECGATTVRKGRWLMQRWKTATRLVCVAALICSAASVGCARQAEQRGSAVEGAPAKAPAKAPAPATATAKAKLEMVALASPQSALCRPGSSGFRVIGSDVIYMGQPLAVGSGAAEGKHALAGKELKLGVRGTNLLVSYEGVSTKLEQQEMGFGPVTLQISPGRSYVLAIPYGYVYQYRVLGVFPQSRGDVMLRSGAVQRFELDGQVVSFFDANTDGYYRAGDDGVAIGAPAVRCSVFSPLGKLMATRRGVYEIVRLAEDGSEVEYRPYEGKTSKLSFAGGASDLEFCAAVGSEDGGLSFALPLSSVQAAELTVVPGRYNLLYGLVYSPTEKKLVGSVAGGNAGAVEVAAGESRSVTFGGPYTFEFAVTAAGGQMGIHSSGFSLRGRGGEKYENFGWASEPQIGVVSGGKSTPLGKMEFG